MKKLLLITCSIAALFFAACKKDKQPTPDNPYGLPNATTEGKNIFACRVNGQNWISKTSIYNLGGGVSNDTLYAHGSNPSSTTYYEQYDIAIAGFSYLNNIYLLNDTSIRFAQFSTNNQCFVPQSGLGVGIGKNYEGQLTITKLDTTTKILSGIFWFNISTDNCDTMKITDGRFDIKYY
ncbi:MAG: hypothetical protein J0H76_14215 [Sphingobacteriales bacterium]|nr:hypothetical protein [Sphingobacteriales bacterium]